MSPGRGVVNFRLRPPSFILWMAALVVVVGWVFGLALKESLPLPDRPVASLPLYIGAALAGIILVGATSKFWFQHLLRDRKHHDLPNRSTPVRPRRRRHSHEKRAPRREV